MLAGLALIYSIFARLVTLNYRLYTTIVFKLSPSRWGNVNETYWKRIDVFDSNNICLISVYILWFGYFFLRQMREIREFPDRFYFFWISFITGTYVLNHNQ